MIQNLTHVDVSLTATEQVSYSILEKLVKLVGVSLDDTSKLTGKVTSDYAYKDTVDSLMAKFPTFTIEYTNRLLRFTENPELLAWCLDNIDTNEDGAIGLNELAVVTDAELADDITNLKESDEFTNVLVLMSALKNLKGGSSLAGDIDISSNTAVETVDMSGTQTVNIDGVSDKTSLSDLGYHSPTEVSISGCTLLNIDNTNYGVANLTSDELDELAHAVCGVKLTADDDGVAYASIKDRFDNINIVNEYYTDSVENLQYAGYNISTNDAVGYVRILDSTSLTFLNNLLGKTKFLIEDFLKLNLEYKYIGANVKDASWFKYCTLYKIINLSGVFSNDENKTHYASLIERIDFPPTFTEFNTTAARDGFYLGTNLKTVGINSSIYFGGLYAFRSSNIEKIIIDTVEHYLGCRYDTAEGNCPSYNKQAYLYFYSDENTPIGTETNPLVIPTTITKLNAYALYNFVNITNINYEGTIAEWLNITKETSWHYNVSATYVLCTDGKAGLDDTTDTDNTYTETT